MQLLSRSTASMAMALLLACVSSHAQVLAIVGGTIVDGTGRAPMSDGVIVITGGRISSIGRLPAVKIPPQARQIDARAKYLVPGLMDANVHLMMNIDPESLVRYDGRYHEIALEAAQIALKTGQTTVFDTYGPRAALMQARDLVNSGKAPGSRIYLAGGIIGFTGPLGADMCDPAVSKFLSRSFVERTNAAWEQGAGRELIWMQPEEVRARIRAYARTGVNFLKYGSSGHGAWPEAATFEYIAFSPRVQKVIIEEGHRAGLTVQAHTTTVESLDMAIEAGVDLITHGDISGQTTVIPQETLDKLVRRGIPVSVMPVTERHLEAVLEGLRRSPRRLDYRKLAKANQRNMIKAGVTMLLSVDAGLIDPVLAAESTNPAIRIDPTGLGEGHFNAFVALQEMGMAPMEILKSATSHIARAYKVDADLGTLEQGKVADMVLLERNPLADARNYRSIRLVIKDGRIVDLDALPVAPVITAKVAQPVSALKP